MNSKKAIKASARNSALKGRLVCESAGAIEANHSAIFVGPSVEGGDEKYVKIVSGQVSRKKPSFAR